jgi:hypothetical protein
LIACYHLCAFLVCGQSSFAAATPCTLDLNAINALLPAAVLQELLVVQLLPGQLCNTMASAAALWLMHMLLFLLGPLPGWLQQQTNGTGKGATAAAAAFL